MNKISKEKRRKNMQAIKCKGSKIEIVLGKALWKEGLRYRKNYKEVYGKPDFCFIRKKVAVFCDSEFWHGKKLRDGEIIKTNIKFWEEKLKNNILRDKKVTEKLESDGWIVIRLWGCDILKNTEKCVTIIKDALNE